MNCIICSSLMGEFITKTFNAFGLHQVDYHRCPNCGFVGSRTHADMVPSDWQRLNQEVHALYQGRDLSPYDDPFMVPRLRKQAALLLDAQQLGLLKAGGRWLDYACGDGRLADLARQEHGLSLLKYERFMQRRDDYLQEADLLPHTFDFVLTTSVFEHLTRRDQLDAIASLVASTGVLGIHTLVCQAVPADPTWFYMNPVHCAFYTNHSMQLLLQQWGYTCSTYDPEAKLWLCFRDPPRAIAAIVARANSRPDAPPYVFKPGFVDYWKGSPMKRSFPEPEKPTPSTPA